MRFAGGEYSSAYKDRQILFHLLPELNHLAHDTEFQVFREYDFKRDKVKYTIYWKERGKKFRLEASMKEELMMQEPQFWELEDLELRVFDV